MTAIVLAFVVRLALASVANVVAALLPSARGPGGIARRVLATATCFGSLAVPFGLTGPPFARILLAQIVVVQVLRVMEIVRTPSLATPSGRLARVLLATYDVDLLERTPRRSTLVEMASSTLLLGVGAAGLVLASRLAPPSTPYALAGWPRWLATAAAGYVLMQGMTRQWCAILPPFGWQHPPLQRAPHRSRSLAELWGQRWNIIIHRWLRATFFAPLARRGAPRAGVLASFAASGLLHLYIVLPAAGVVPALWMGSFFLAHGLITLVETRLGVRRLRPALGRTYVVGVFAGTAPLFLEPMLRSLGL